MTKKRAQNSFDESIDKQPVSRSEGASTPEAQSFATGSETKAKAKPNKPVKAAEQATKRVTVYMTPSEYKAIRTACFEREEKMSDVMTRLAMGWVKNR